MTRASSATQRSTGTRPAADAAGEDLGGEVDEFGVFRQGRTVITTCPPGRR